MGFVRHLLSSDLDDELLLGRTLREHVASIKVPPGGFVVLDPLCPLVPADFVADLVARVVETGVAHAGVRPVTDTVKVLHGGLVGETVDRASLVQLASPVVLPEAASLRGSLADVVAGLDEVVLVEAPALARRVGDRSDIDLLEVLAQSI